MGSGNFAGSGHLDDDPAARPVAVLVVATPFVLACELLNHTSAESEEIAGLLAAAIVTAIDNTTVTPAVIAIRHRTLVGPLTRELTAYNIAVMLQSDLPGVNDALRSLLGHVFGGIAPLERLRSQPETWAGWGMPHALVTHMFKVSADYYRAAPWKTSTLELPIFVSRPGGHEWAAIVLGAAGQQTGLTCYYDPDDLERMHATSEHNADTALSGILGTVIALLFNTRGELPKRMRDEIKTARWDVAGPNAYPTLTVLNTPGGGIQQKYFEDLSAALISVPRFVEAFAPAFAGEMSDDTDISWTDPETGMTCRMELEDYGFPDPWSKYDALTPAGAEGVGATPLASPDEASAAKSVTRTLTRFRAWLRNSARGKPITNEAVKKHADVVRFLVELCAHGGGKPASALSEFELREFLYDWYPRKVADTERGAKAMIGSLKKFFEFLEEREQVHCPWAAPILADSATFQLRWSTFPGGFFWDETVQDWQAEHARDMIARLLLPVSDSSVGIQWDGMMGIVEHALFSEAHRLWLSWRDEVVRSGIAAPRDVLAIVLQRQAAWFVTPNARCEGVTPKVAIDREREMSRRLSQE